MIENSKKKGFTLIELLIVIGIIMMISSIGVNGYISYRREAMVFFTVDSAVAQIKELRDKTIHGEDEALCYGIYFKKDNAEDAKYSAEIFKEKYVGKKVWNAISRNWEYKGCSEDMTDFSLAEEKTRDFEIDSSIDIKSVVFGDNKTPVNDFVLRFLPPEGDMAIFKDGLYQSDFTPQDKIEIQFGLSGTTRLQRSLLIDLQNGQFENITSE